MQQRKTIHLAGWLFADLLLGLAMLFITSMVGLPIPTPSPTLPPGVTPTATLTRTPTPTLTRTPTATMTPAGSGPGNAPATPTPAFGLNSTPFLVTLRVDPNLMPAMMANPNSSAASTVRNQLGQQIRECFQKFDGRTEAGMVLTFGGSPNLTYGNQLAAIASALLREQLPRVFTLAPRKTVFKDMHAVSRRAAVNGTVELEVYFLSSPEFPINPIQTLGSTCNPPPVWCVDTAPQRAGTKVPITVYNWAGANGAPLNLTINGRSDSVPTAEGENPVYKCFLTEPGRIAWTATWGRFDGQGSVNVEAASTLNVCVRNGQLAVDCQGDSAPDDGRGK
jgi:hypothetical protein